LYFISGYTRIRNNKVENQHGELFSATEIAFNEFADRYYRFFNVNYPKFHKMDSLCKLGFIGADILLNNNILNEKYNPFDIAIILSNCNSSLETDLKHHQQAVLGPASPAVFVYSLPNIVIGEICIRHRIKGENTFFIEREFNIPEQTKYISLLLNSGAAEVCIGGWVELLGNNYDCFLFLVEKTKSDKSIPFNEDEIKKLYTSTDE
jgi:hypothetical protein